jgi:glycosyltransferase involved in cell wall biosynthesis
MSYKPRVAIIGTRGYGVVYSGFETWVRELCDGLKHKYEFHVYTHSNLVNDKPKVLNGVHMHYFPAIETKFLAQYSHSTQATLHAIAKRYDIYLYASTANGIYGPLLKALGKRTAINVDGLDWLRPKWKGLGGKVFYNSAKLATKTFDVLIGDAVAISKYYAEEFKSDSISIAYGAHIFEGDVDATPLPNGLVENDYYLCVGRLIPDNHLAEIVEGFKKSQSAKKLVIVGDLPYKDDYVNELKKLADDRVVFTGYVRDQALLRALYLNCFAYVHGHAFGGTNPSLLKALAYGCCVLAHDNPFNREVLNYETHGLYFNGDATSISNTISRIETDNDLVEQYKRTARSRIREAYTWEHINEQYDALFQKMLNEPKWKCNKHTFTGGAKSNAS